MLKVESKTMHTHKWDLQKCLNQCSPKIITMNHILTHERLSSDDITLDLITEAYEVMARIVTQHGDRYLPIFQRLHNEIEEYRSHDSLLKLAKNIARNNYPQKIKTDK